MHEQVTILYPSMTYGSMPCIVICRSMPDYSATRIGSVCIIVLQLPESNAFKECDGSSAKLSVNERKASCRILKGTVISQTDKICI